MIPSHGQASPQGIDIVNATSRLLSRYFRWQISDYFYTSTSYMKNEAKDLQAVEVWLIDVAYNRLLHESKDSLLTPIKPGADPESPEPAGA